MGVYKKKGFWWANGDLGVPWLTGVRTNVHKTLHYGLSPIRAWDTQTRYTAHSSLLRGEEHLKERSICL